MKRSKGTKMAAKTRARCNNLTQEERDNLLKKALEIAGFTSKQKSKDNLEL